MRRACGIGALMDGQGEQRSPPEVGECPVNARQPLSAMENPTASNLAVTDELPASTQASVPAIAMFAMSNDGTHSDREVFMVVSIGP